MTLRASDAAPFAVAVASITIEQANAYAAFLLTCLGIAHVGRKLWLSFRAKSDRG